MRTRALHLAAATAALLATAAPARAFDAGGSLGAGYSRRDDSGVGVTDGWNFAGSLTLGGEVITDGGLNLNASGFYGAFSNTGRYVGGPTSDTKTWGATASAAAMTSTWHPASAFYSRSVTDATTTLEAGPSATGTVTTTTTGVSATVMPVDAPRLGAQLTHTESSNRDTSGNLYTSGGNAISVNLGHGTPGGVDYDLTWTTGSQTGSLAASNFDSHQVLGHANVALTRDVSAGISVTYNLRVPTATDPTSPRVESDGLTTTVSSPLGRSASNVAAYSYAMNLLGAPGQPVQQQTAHTVSDNVSRQLDPHWLVGASVSASSATSRTGDATTSTTGEGVGGNVGWTATIHEYQLGASASGSIGAIQLPGQDALAWGAGAGGNAAHDLGPVQTSLGYAISYSDNVGAVEQSALTQSVALGAGWKPHPALSLNASANVRASRIDSKLFGVSGNRSSQATLGASVGNAGLILNAGIAEGLAANLRSGTGDALFLPLAYNTTQRFAGATLTAGAGSVSGSAYARILSNDYPDRPHEYERIAGVTARWTFGAWALMGDARVSSGAAGDALVRTSSSFTVQLSRGFTLLQ